MVQKAKDEIDKDEKEWLIFNASKKNNQYILQGSASTYTAKIEDNIITIYKDGKITGTKGKQQNQINTNDPSTTGRFDNTVANITYSRSEKRFNINIGNNTTIITGYGGFANDSYPDPWNQVVPIIYKEGGSTIAMMDYVGNKKDLYDLKEQLYLPMEILVSKEYEKYVPLLFEIYVLSSEYIASL